MSYRTPPSFWWLAAVVSAAGCSGKITEATPAPSTGDSRPETGSNPADENLNDDSSASSSPSGGPASQLPSSADEGSDPATSVEVSPEHPDNSAPSPSSGPAAPTAPSSLFCGGSLPASFIDSCAGCHTVSGAPNDRYPDLYQFAQDGATFLERVRRGGSGMLAYSPSVITDEDVMAVFTYFTAGASRSGAAPADLGSVEPLSSGMDVTRPPIVFTRQDGVLVTRGAGRVRQRHELEGTFNPFGPLYFEDRSFGIIVEDFTPTGESLIRVSYLPVGQPTPGTNFRAWKIYGEGNVFHANMGMDAGELPSLLTPTRDWGNGYVDAIAGYTSLQVQKTTTNSRTGNPIAPGDLFEFEFGVFLEPDALREGSRTSYYSDTFRYQVGVGGFTPNNADDAGRQGPVRSAQQGGNGTNVWLYEDEEFAFEQMALNIQHENVQPFLRGRRLFHTDFETGEHSEPGNPTFEEQAGLAGPRRVTSTCEACHVHNGPGKLLQTFDATASTTFKLYDAGDLGNQLQLQEGDVRVVGMETKDVVLGDGTVVPLSRPLFAVTSSDGAELKYSPRLARKLIGLGLLEAIDEATLLSRADPEDCDGNGISGRPSLVLNLETGAWGLGRFGWKAEKLSLRHQVADALEADLGVGTRLLPDAEGKVELDEVNLDDLTAYMRLLSVPAQRNQQEPAVAAGEILFRTVGCASCHVTDTVTGNTHPFFEFRQQAIKPYTDLLLHDMGEDLADASGLSPGATTAPPGASEWRTPPLWGLGLYAVVNGNTGLMHDGRAANVTEAILWHGGEAQIAKDRFSNLSTSERDALLAFVESL